MNDKIRQEAMHLHNWCEGQYDCAHCDFGRDNRTCKISGIPAQWFDDEDHSADVGKKGGNRWAEISKAVDSIFGTPTGTPTDTPTTRAEILDAAKKIVTGEQEKQYGKPEDNFAVIAEFWTTYIGHPISSEDVAIMMVLLKIARIRSGNYKTDSFVDGVGYLSLAAETAGR